jgi:spermidine synthase
MAYLFAVGFVSILGQVILLRELSVAFYGVELIYTLAIGAWLFSGACGAMIGRRSFKPSFTWINLLFLLLSISLPLNVAFIRSIRPLFGDTPGAYLPLHIQIAGMFASLLPLGLLFGLLFQWAAKIYIADKKSLAVAYAIESLGGLAGGICSSLFLRFGFQNFSIAVLCALAAIGASFLEVEDQASKWLRSISLIITAVLILFLWRAPGLDRLMTSWAHPNLVETQDTPYSRVTVTLLNGQVSVFENDALLFDTEETQTEEFIHVAALQHPNPERVLVLGGGIAGTISEVLRHKPRSVDYVELNSSLLGTVKPHLPVEIQKSFQAENVRVIFDDPRRFLNRALSYDLIIIGMPEPTSGQANRFYTREFFQQCLAKVNAHGIIAFSIQSSENFWTPPLTRRMVSIYRAARAAFSDIVVVPGGTNIVVCSRDRLTRDPSILAARLNARAIKTRLVSAAYLRYRYTNDRFLEVSRTLESGTTPVNTDIRPICYQYTIMLWLSKFLPSAKFWDFSLPEPKNSRLTLLWPVLALILLALLLSLAPWPVRRAFLTGIAGFVGMVLEIILMLHFQIKNGILYQDVGILLTGFMAGLALGALSAAKTNPRFYRVLGIAMLSGLIVLSAGIGAAINSGGNTSMAEILALLLLAGFFVAGIFAYASLHNAGDQMKIVTPLYSADLIGGCMGSLTASLFLVPVAGLGAAAYLMVPIALLSAVLL